MGPLRRAGLTTVVPPGTPRLLDPFGPCIPPNLPPEGTPPLFQLMRIKFWVKGDGPIFEANRGGLFYTGFWAWLPRERERRGEARKMTAPSSMTEALRPKRALSRALGSEVIGFASAKSSSALFFPKSILGQKIKIQCDRYPKDRNKRNGCFARRPLLGVHCRDGVFGTRILSKRG
ncbi:MAG: hypothetical protein CM15mP78_10540 [Candidatus Poseidoniales archaeon]|nr:MAG: hypothetical protein CM15mP78_10540 [Candidatus Poseidoniales archaeon]